MLIADRVSGGGVAIWSGKGKRIFIAPLGRRCDSTSMTEGDPPKGEPGVNFVNVRS